MFINTSESKTKQHQIILETLLQLDLQSYQQLVLETIQKQYNCTTKQIEHIGNVL